MDHHESDGDMFARVVGLTPVEQQAFVERLTAQSPEHGSRLGKLLEAHAKAEASKFLEGTPGPALPQEFSLLDHPAISADGSTLDPPGAIGAGSVAPAAVIPGYVLMRFMGRGGSGEVWLARRTLTQHLCAVKIFRDVPQGELEGIRAYKQVAADHPGLLPIEEVGQVGPYIYCTMPRADNAAAGDAQFDLDRYLALSLRTHLDRAGKLPILEVASIGEGLAWALEHLHHRDLVHGDVKPENVLSVGGAWKLADFGTLGDRNRRRGHTPGYSPPDHIGTPYHDRYALGVSLFELASGMRSAEFDVELLGRLPQLSSDLAGRQLASVIRRLTLPVSQAGFASCGDAAHALSAISAVRARVWWNRPAVAGAIVLTASIAGGVALLSRPGGYWGAPLQGPIASEEAKPLIASVELTVARGQPIVTESWSVPGPTSVTEVVREDDGLRFHAEFGQPMYAYLLVLPAAGEVVELVWPSDLDSPPNATDRIDFPGAHNAFWALQEGPGLHAFVLLASPDPLPSFAQWRRTGGQIPWPRSTSEAVAQGAMPMPAFVFDGQRVAAASGTRGVVTRQMAPKPFDDLVASLSGLPKGLEARAIMVPVHPRP